MARLILTQDGEERTIELSTTDATGIGRDATNTIPLDGDGKASRRHCQIMPLKRDGRLIFEVTDLGATNKTRVNGKGTDRRVLSHGDVLEVGKASMRFEDPEEEAALKEAGAKGVCFLEWITGGNKGQKVLLDKPRVTMGRRDSNTVLLDDRMSSSHHAEVTKDLNGYTVRDLGSTNGTLVNGAPITEVELKHGDQVRIGNTRFLFKDPSMKDIEVELSQFEDDDGWGMVGDIDITKARGGGRGLLLALLVVGLIVGGGFFLLQQADQRTQVGSGDDANLVAFGSFEDDDAELLWVTRGDAEGITIARRAKGGRSGGGLEIQNEGDTATGEVRVVEYEDDFEALPNRPFTVSADLRGRGEGLVAFVAVWRAGGEGVRGAVQTVRLAEARGGWTSVDATLVKPAWANRLSVGVLVSPECSATLDNCRVERTSGGDTPGPIDLAGGHKGAISASGGFEVITREKQGVLLGAHPVALKGGARLDDFQVQDDPSGGDGLGVQGTFVDGEDEHTASVRFSATDEGFRVDLSGQDVDRIGLTFDLRRGLSGDLLNLLTETRATAIPLADGQKAEAVRKALAGDPSQGALARGLLTFAADEGAANGTVEVHDADDRGLVRLTYWLPSKEGSFNVIVDHSRQSQAAKEALDQAELMLRTRPGQGIRQLQQVAREYPFIENVRKDASKAAREAEAETRKQLTAWRTALADFEIYQSVDSLAALDKASEGMAERFPPVEGDFLAEQVQELVKATRDARATYNSAFAGPELSRLERLGDLLRTTEGYEAMAAIYYRAILDRFGDMAGEDTPFGRRVLAAKKAYEELMGDEQVRNAVPPTPEQAR